MPVVGSFGFVLLASCCSPPSPVVGQANSGPVTLLGVPQNQLIRWPSIAVRSDTVFVAANVFPLQGDSLMVRPAYLGRLRQNEAGDLVALAPLDLPPGDFQFAYPRIIPAGGRLHLVWGEFGSSPRTTAVWPPSRVTSLWHAVLDSGPWSAPERFATAYWFGWNDQTGDVAVDASGALHVAAWKGDTGSIPRVQDFRLAGGQWESSSLPYTGLNQATAIATRGDTVVIALVDEPLDTARVMVVESTDSGTHWTNPIVASWRPRSEGSVSHLAFGTTADGLLLAIGEKANDSFYLDTIRVLRLYGAPARSTPQFVTPPPTADQFVLAGTSCGAVVMLTRNFSSNLQIFQVTIPRDSSGAVTRPLLSTAGFSASPGVAAGRRSAIAMFAYNTAAGAPGRSAAMTLPVCSP